MLDNGKWLPQLLLVPQYCWCLAYLGEQVVNDVGANVVVDLVEDTIVTVNGS